MGIAPPLFFSVYHIGHLDWRNIPNFLPGIVPVSRTINEAGGSRMWYGQQTSDG